MTGALVLLHRRLCACAALLHRFVPHVLSPPLLQYISNDDDQQTNNTDLLAAGDAAAAASGALGTVGGRRRLAGGSRALLQTEKSGAELRIVVATASVRTDSEIATFNEGVDSGSMARDFTLAGAWALWRPGPILTELSQAGSGLCVRRACLGLFCTCAACRDLPALPSSVWHQPPAASKCSAVLFTTLRRACPASLFLLSFPVIPRRH